MKFAPHPKIRIIFLFSLINTAVLAAPVERTVSSSRQFIIYGTTTPLRGAVAELAEKTKSNLLGLLPRRDEWKTPIVLNLQFPQANVPEVPAAARHFSQTGSGLKIQLDFTIGADVDAVAIQHELLRAILLEIIYRRQPNLPAGTVYVEPPEWLVEGLLAAAPSKDRTELVDALAPLLSSNNIMPLDEFLRQNPALLDSPARTLYRAYSFALVQLLLDEPAGSSHLAAFIDNLARASSDGLSDLKAQFPALADADDLPALWRSRLTNVSAAGKYQLFTFAETERKLEALLSVGVSVGGSSGKTMRLEEILRKKIMPPPATELRRLSGELMLLGASAHPVIRPVVVEYQRIAELMSAGKRKGFAVRLAHLKSTRVHLAARMTEIDDYMNWFEATKSDANSGAFSDYLKAAGKSDQPAHRRRDAISVYLDALEAQFEEL